MSKRLRGMGHTVCVATARHAHEATEEEIDGVNVRRFAVRGNAVTGISGEAQAYLQYVLNNPWDVIAMHCTQIWSTDLLLPYLDTTPGRKFVIGHGLSAYTLPEYKRYYSQLADHIRRGMSLIALSNRLEEVQFARDYGLPPPIIIPNGVDLEEWQQPGMHLRERWKIGQRPWLISVSNHSPVKGHALFFEVLQRLRLRIPDVAGTIIGNSYAAERYGIGNLGIKGGCWYSCRARACLSPYVQLKWFAPRTEVVAAMQEADLLLVTSCREAMPIVILERMAAGGPWISLDVGAVDDYSGGRIVKDADAMITEALSLLSDPSSAAALGAEGRSSAIAHHDWNTIARVYERVYQTGRLS